MSLWIVITFAGNIYLSFGPLGFSEEQCRLAAEDIVAMERARAVIHRVDPRQVEGQCVVSGSRPRHMGNT